MLKPYIVEKGVQRFIGRSVRLGGTRPTGEDIGLLYDDMDAIFRRITHPIDDRFYGITINFANSTASSRRTYWLCRQVESLWQDGSSGRWELMESDMESLVLPASRWLYIPVRYDDPFVQELASEEHRDDSGYLTACVYDWGRKWLSENEYQQQDYPFELEIYGLHDGYEGTEGGANITLAIPMV